ncbi:MULTISPECIES: hypothetical protein [Spirosoma]|uniref:Uncharacterized protein n=1 Tax=Spirosoma sordidisoli TaxID=2502893 RepID=A0A4Q2UXK2_9BACT|nr:MULTISPECIES: hypothetical protein [Spirosoma]RYC71789.1 hypothetical protein EQG79_06585 [Spirosoma sordidisoli]
MTNQLPYTSIPDTSDTIYWEPKSLKNNLRSTTFVPRDRELHQQLRVKAWAVIQASLSKRNKKAKY